MEQLLQNIFSILTNSPGSLIYQMVILITLLAVLQVNQAIVVSNPTVRSHRIRLGLIILISLQITLFIITGLGWQQLFDVQLFLPPIDRTINLLTIIWLIWLWTFPQNNRTTDAIHIFINLLVIMLSVFSVFQWQQSGIGQSFNQNALSKYWDISGLIVILAGMLILLLKHPTRWQFGFSAFVILSIGYALNFIVPQYHKDYAAVLRFAFLLAYPLLLYLPAFEGQFEQKEPAPPTPALTRPPGKERRRYSTDPKAFATLIHIAAEIDPELILDRLTHGIAQAMLSDLCYLVWLSEDKTQLILRKGYDLIREENLEGKIITSSSMPLVTSAILRGKPIRLSFRSNASIDLQSLSESIGLANPGNLLIIPLVEVGKVPSWGILLLSPYSNRDWNNEDQNYLVAVNDTIIQIINKLAKREYPEQITEINPPLSENQALKAQPNPFSIISENTDSPIPMDPLSINKDTAEYHQIIESLQNELEQLQTELTIARSSGNGRAINREYLENELRIALEEVARLQNALAESNIRLIELEKNTTNMPTFNQEQAEVMASIAQELRQPMSSIIGYTDLILGESVGLLGALQKKFLERIRASTERMRSLIDDLIHITAIESGQFNLIPENVDINQVIDTAMAYVSAQYREKNISLQVEIEENLPLIQADRDALQQIIIHLMQNSGTATPNDDLVQMKVKKQVIDDQPFLLIEVTDHGGGIPEEDLPRVFSRLYRADNPLIQGVGDTGVGLSIVKTLVEAHLGRIWVDSESRKSTTFHILLPVNKTTVTYEQYSTPR